MKKSNLLKLKIESLIKESPLTTFCSLLIISANLLQFSLKPSGFSQGDSWAYGYGSVRNWSNLSFTGEALRKWPIVLINTTLASPTLQTLFQFLFSIAAWCSLIWVLSKYLDNHLTTVLITILALSPQVLNWNSVHLSESYAISTGILTLSTFFAKYKGNKTFVFSLLSLFVFLNTKPSNFMAFLLLTPMLSLYLIKKWRTIKFTRAIILFLIVVYTLSLTVNQSKGKLQTDGAGISYAAAQSVAVISNVNPLTNQIYSELKNNQELRCLGDFNKSSPIALTELLKYKCRASQNWLDQEFQRWYFGFNIRNLDYPVKLTITTILAGNSPFSMYGGSISILPTEASQLFFGDRNFALRLSDQSSEIIPIDSISILSPLVFWLVLIVFIYLKNQLFNARKFDQVRSKYVMSISLILFLYGLVLLVVSAVSIPNEWFRQSIVGQISILVSGILLLSDVSKKYFKSFN
jgi:hypothetical protein